MKPINILILLTIIFSLSAIIIVLNYHNSIAWSATGIRETESGLTGLDTRNRPPQIYLPPMPQVVDEGECVGFRVRATDPDRDAVYISARNLPKGSVFIPETGKFYWCPSYRQAGIYDKIEITATDEKGATALERVKIIVKNILSPPRITLCMDTGETTRGIDKTVAIEVQVGSIIGLDKIIIHSYTAESPVTTSYYISKLDGICVHRKILLFKNKSEMPLVTVYAKDVRGLSHRKRYRI